MATVVWGRGPAGRRWPGAGDPAGRTALGTRWLDAFTDDGSVDDWGRIFTGRAEIERWSDREFVGANGTMTPEQAGEEDGEITVVADWRSSHANGRSRFTFRIEGDRLARMTIREG